MWGQGCALHVGVVGSHPATTRSAPHRGTTDDWLVDPVNGAAARWGFGPLCTVRVTHLADDATAIGVSFHHVDRRHADVDDFS